MKKLIVLSMIAALFACNSNSQSSEEENGIDGKPESEKKVTKRDYSINESNAYNAIFFDSAKLEQFIQKENLDAKISRRLRSFYNARNYQFAWFTPNGLTEQARGFWNLHSYHTTYTQDTSLTDKKLSSTMNNLISEDGFSVSAANATYLTTELKLTEHFIKYTLNNVEDGYVKRKEMERFIPRKKEDALTLADSLVTKKHKDNKYYEEVNEPYKRLKAELAKHVAIAKQGGWPQVNISAKQLKRGVSSPVIPVIRKRLQISGDIAAADSSSVYDSSLVQGIMRFQTRHGYTADGKLTDAQIKDMNVPVMARVEQLLINMGRMQWMINQPKGKLIMVNIPEFILHVKEGSSKIFDMDVVVGKEGHNTMMFTGNLNQVVFSPHWNVPVSIVKNEILPAMARNPNYLSGQNMEITGNNGGLPVIRQLPGGKNALGRVKFLFPNDFDIYFHDTPSKSLFQKDKRAFSHGCIRLSDPVKMANYLLKDHPEWSPERIEDAMNSGNEKYVKLKNPVPVLITYYTSWVDDEGLLHFAEDIYDHDSRLASKMFIASHTSSGGKNQPKMTRN